MEDLFEYLLFEDWFDNILNEDSDACFKVKVFRGIWVWLFFVCVVAREGAHSLSRLRSKDKWVSGC